MTERTPWDDRIPRPTMLIDRYDADGWPRDDSQASANDSAAEMPESVDVDAAALVTELPPSDPSRAATGRRRRAKAGMVAAALVIGLGAGMAAGYLLWDRPQQQRIDELQTAIAATSGDAAQLRVLGDDKAQLNEKLAAATSDAAACRKSTRAAQGLDAQWQVWAEGFQELLMATTEKEATRILDRLAKQYDKIVRQEGRVDTLAEQCVGQDRTASA